MKTDYTKLDKKDLLKRLSDLEIQKISYSNHKMVNPKTKAENFTNIRREIARIKTELTRRKNEI